MKDKRYQNGFSLLWQDYHIICKIYRFICKTFKSFWKNIILLSLKGKHNLSNGLQFVCCSLFNFFEKNKANLVPIT